MNERFDKVINKMDEQTEKAVEVQEQVSALFGNVKKTQKEIDGKVDKITKELEKTFTNFEKESGAVFADIKSEFDKQKTGADEAVSDALGKLKSLQDDYDGKVKDLITSIDGKSKEILKIYDELDNIKKVQQEATTTFGELADTQKELIANFICEKLYKYFISPVLNKEITSELASTFISNNFELIPVYNQLFKSEHFFDLKSSNVL